MTDEETTDRRTFLAGAAGATALAALAGCAEPQDGDADGDDANSGPSAGAPPSMDFDLEGINPEWRFVLESIEYQNQALAELRGEH